MSYSLHFHDQLKTHSFRYFTAAYVACILSALISLRISKIFRKKEKIYELLKRILYYGKKFSTHFAFCKNVTVNKVSGIKIKLTYFLSKHTSSPSEQWFSLPKLVAQVAACSIEGNHCGAKKSRNKPKSRCFRPQWRSEQFPRSQARSAPRPIVSSRGFIVW